MRVTVADDGQPAPFIKPGDLAVVLEGAMLADEGDNPDLHFTAPIPPLLLLDYAADCRARADKDRRRLERSFEWREDNTWGLGPKLGPRVFDTIANEIASITFAWMALEAFANFAIQK